MGVITPTLRMHGTELPGLMFLRRQMTSKLILRLAEGVFTPLTAVISAWLIEARLSNAASRTELTSLKTKKLFDTFKTQNVNLNIFCPQCYQIYDLKTTRKNSIVKNSIQFLFVNLQSFSNYIY